MRVSPKDQISTSGPYGNREMTSGLIQYGVPTNDFRLGNIVSRRPLLLNIFNVWIDWFFTYDIYFLFYVKFCFFVQDSSARVGTFHQVAQAR